MAGLIPAGAVDAGAFLARLVRIDPAALVRLRPAGPGTTALWSPLPWAVMVTRQVAGGDGKDRTVPAATLLALLAGASDADPDLGELPDLGEQWRWPLPSSAGTVMETIPAAEIRRVGLAAAQTLQAVGESGVAGRAVGERALRDALLGHVPIVVRAGDVRVDVPQRLVQAVLRMGFLGTGEDPSAQPAVAVRVAGSWVGLAAGYGSAWRQREGGLAVRTSR